MTALPSLLHDAATGYDNVTGDTGRVVVLIVGAAVALAIVVMAGLAVAVERRNGTIDFVTFGGGVAAVLGGFASLLGALGAYVWGDAHGERTYRASDRDAGAARQDGDGGADVR